MKTKLIYLILGLGLIFTLSCTKYPPDSERLLEDLTVVTQYDTDTSFHFSDYKTYAVVDTIVKITDIAKTKETGSDVMTITNQIRKNMYSRGFTEVTSQQWKADFLVQVVYFQNTTIYTYYYDWWGYYPYYGYYYPYYPVYYSSYTTGLADIELIDQKVTDPENHKMYLRWNGYIRGLVTSGHSTSEITGAIDQAFIQTPQLVTTAK